ncbi:putative endonuclease lcl3 [Spiromyces aspiralis]|uniref:Endonuclease lcl3 n=1 Tax=Spiromyces aspiralis TaxID=68401 RepID=A0ACC1HY33_9FUNG|nr:putative endonuclease lcl3 [Spiromyces aspiralis]
MLSSGGSRDPCQQLINCLSTTLARLIFGTVAALATVRAPIYVIIITLTAQQAPQALAATSLPSHETICIDALFGRYTICVAMPKSVIDTVRDAINDVREQGASAFMNQHAAGSYLYIAAGGVVTGLVVVGWMHGFRRYPTAAYIPQRVIASHQPIRGWVVHVGDGDNCRVFHTPLLRWFGRPPSSGSRKSRINNNGLGSGIVEVSDYSISVRLAGVDAPEAGHFGNPAQPYSKEAKEFLTKLLLNKRVTLIPYRRDQYERVVAMVYYRKWGIFVRNASEELVKAGLAEVYYGGQAEHGGVLKELKRLEKRARSRKVGMWSQKLSDYISPQQYKRAIRNSSGLPPD